MILHRGLSLPSNDVERHVDDIRRNGLLAGAGRWRMLFHDLKPRLEALMEKPTLQRSDVDTGEETPPWACACAQRRDALYYACRHNVSATDDASVVVTFEAPQRDIIIDGRDFLYPVFQFGDPERARPVLTSAFGSSILRYADRAWSSQETQTRIAYCDLAVQDDEVIAAHAGNTTILGGKQGTVFSSAFMARAPILPGDIRSVDIVRTDEYKMPRTDTSFRDIITL